MNWTARIGLAIVRPQRALSIASDRRFAGRSGSDLLRMIAVLLLATQLRGLIASIWLVQDSVQLAMRGVVHVLTRSLTLDLGFLIVGALALWLAGGARRDLGRAFDLACVAVLPLLFVDIAATFAFRALDARVPADVALVLTLASWAWTGVVLALATRAARPTSQPPPANLVVAARRAGLGVIAIAAVGTAIQIAWIAAHLEQIRPVTAGDPAPGFALPTIVDDRGTLGARRELAASAGHVVVVDFWATWCGPCIKSLPELEALSHRPGVEVIAINQDDPAAAWRLFAAQRYTMALLADDGLVSDRYRVTTIPHTVVIDRAGIVRLVARGASGELEAIVEQIRK